MMTAAQQRYLDEIVRSEQGRLLGFIRKKVADEEDARDIMQDVLYQLTLGFNDIRSASRITAWIFTVARNRIADYRRKHRTERLQDRVVRQADGEEMLMMEDILPALTRSPEDEYMRGVIWERIEASLERLPEKQRDVFIMNEFEDMSFREIFLLRKMGGTGDRRDHPVHLRGHVALELARAGTLQGTRDQLLADTGPAGALQDPLLGDRGQKPRRPRPWSRMRRPPRSLAEEVPGEDERQGGNRRRYDRFIINPAHRFIARSCRRGEAWADPLRFFLSREQLPLINSRQT